MFYVFVSKVFKEFQILLFILFNVVRYTILRGKTRYFITAIKYHLHMFFNIILDKIPLVLLVVNSVINMVSFFVSWLKTRLLINLPKLSFTLIY